MQMQTLLQSSKDHLPCSMIKHPDLRIFWYHKYKGLAEAPWQMFLNDLMTGLQNVLPEQECREVQALLEDKVSIIPHVHRHTILV